MNERKVIVTWEAIYDIVDITESIESNFGKRVADNFELEIYRKIISLEQDADIFRELEKTIADRKIHPVEKSYTNYLLNEGVDKICKKVGEEASEY